MKRSRYENDLKNVRFTNFHLKKWSIKLQLTINKINWNSRLSYLIANTINKEDTFKNIILSKKNYVNDALQSSIHPRQF